MAGQRITMSMARVEDALYGLMPAYVRQVA